MRILYHHRTLGDGAEGIHIREMVSAFRGLGHEVRVISVAAADVNEGRRGIVDRVRSLLPGSAYELATAACNPIEYSSVRRAIADFKPDLLYKRHARNDIAALSAARDLGVSSVLEVNCLFSSVTYWQFEPVTFRGLTEYLERRALSLASIVLAVSSPLAEHARALAGRPVKILPNGANPDVFDASRTFTGQNPVPPGVAGAVKVGWAGILREWHGLELLVDAVARVPNLELVVIGDGPARAQLEDRARALGISDRLVVTGRIPHSDMPRHLAVVDVAVVPDERTGIASPMKLLEYMAMGLAVIAPDLPNIRDIVTPDVDGLLFRSGDLDELSGILARLAVDRELRVRLGTNARTKIRRERTWTRNAQAVLEWVGECRSAQCSAAAATA
jgi:glycosyltransferase involved in cell wall biosynthesis